jgi:hypothetical protein
MMTWEGSQLMGTQAIIEKINVRPLPLPSQQALTQLSCLLRANEQSLPFEQVQHRVSMIDAQPSSATVASLIVLVTGHLIVDGNTEQPMPYSQMFQVSFRGFGRRGLERR